MRTVILLSIIISFVSCEPLEIKPVKIKSAKTRSASSPKPAPSAPSITLVPLGNVSDSDIKFIKKELEGFYQVPVAVHKRIPLDPKLQVKGTKKYQANLILNFLNSEFKNTKGKVLALTKRDICIERELNGVVHKNWGIFGLGIVGGKSCVVSTHRFGKKNFGRLSKVAIHEVGHTLGIPHCETSPDCLMGDAKGKGKKLDTKKPQICGKCKAKIKW
jgi:archaemetzincin